MLIIYSKKKEVRDSLASINSIFSYVYTCTHTKEDNCHCFENSKLHTWPDEKNGQYLFLFFQPCSEVVVILPIASQILLQTNDQCIIKSANIDDAKRKVVNAHGEKNHKGCSYFVMYVIHLPWTNKKQSMN